MKYVWIGIVFCFFAFSANGTSLENLEQELVNLHDSLTLGKTDDVREKAALEVRNVLLKAFKIEGVFEYPFDNAFWISTLTSQDKVFRLFNWGWPHIDGSYSYFAFVLFPEKGKYIELKDNRNLSTIINNRALNADEWYGAVYYEIYPVKQKRESYYVMMGWDGNNRLSNKKVLDVFEFDIKGKLTIGKPVFETEEGMRHRLVLEYAKSAQVNLRYLKPKNAIIYDRLEPEKPGLKDQYAFYIPSTAYNGYVLNRNGTWDLIEYLDMSRPESEERGVQFNFPERVRIDRLENNQTPAREKR